MPCSIPDRAGWFHEQIFDRSDHDIDGHLIMAALRNDDIRIPLGGLDKLDMHRPDHIQVLINDGLQRPAPGIDIPQEAPDDADIRIRIHINFNVDELS